MSSLYIGLIIAGVGLLLVLAGLVVRGQAGKLASTPLMKTGEAARANGPASCEGTTRAIQQPAVAPCSGTPCVVYQLVIEKKIKTMQGNTQVTKWEPLADPLVSTEFALDDGSGPVTVRLPHTFDLDLEQTYKGAPPGGPGLGSLAPMVPGGLNERSEQIIEFRVSEKVLRPDARAYIVGVAQGGLLTAPQKGKMTVSSRGRDALVGSAKKKSLAILAFGVIALAAGAVVAILRPGEAKACSEPLKGMVARCAVSSSVVDGDRNGKKEKFRRAELKWEVTAAGKYKLTATDPHKGKTSFPSVQVEDKLGLPMNVGLGLGVGDGAWTFTTTTKQLDPGTYTIMVFSNENAPSKLDLEITAP